MPKNPTETEDDENEVETEDEKEVDSNEDQKVEKDQGEDKPTIKKVKSATLKVAKVENTQWLDEKFQVLEGQIAELKTQLTSMQEKTITKKRARFLKRKR